MVLSMYLSACASSTGINLKVHSINSLETGQSGLGEFRGLEFLADPIPGQLKNRVNIFYLHGIGWTENPESDELGNDFLSGIAKAYEMDVDDDIIRSSCGDEVKSDHTSDHIYVTTGAQPRIYETVLPGVSLKLDELVCMDKQIFEVDQNLEYVVYRIFWDNIFWDSLQAAHVGQDDDRDGKGLISSMRRKFNRRLKDEIVNYGFSDAVMYLGPAGEDIRRAIRGAMCSAALDAAGFDFGQQGHDVAYDEACKLASNTSIKANQFAFVAESLGSKITFDVMREAMSDGQDTILDDMIAGSEIYMLANQIALLSLSDLNVSTRGKPYVNPDKPRPQIIALSEVNDILTYEINPFFEQLWARQQGIGRQTPLPFDDNVRALLIENIGFNFIDVRLEFADKIVPMLDFVDPMQAHLGHASEPELMLYILCGVKYGKLNQEACLATADFE